MVRARSRVDPRSGCLLRGGGGVRAPLIRTLCACAGEVADDGCTETMGPSQLILQQKRVKPVQLDRREYRHSFD